MTDLSNSMQNVDLTNCDREPIHQLGRVQSYGAMIAVSSDWIIQHASENLTSILGVSVDDVSGQPLNRVLDTNGFERIRENMRHVQSPDSVVRLFDVPLRTNNQKFDVSFHQSGMHLIIEFEPKTEQAGRDVSAEVFAQIAKLRHPKNLNDLTQRAATAMAELCGFDSVMVYQFQPDHSGEVLAEVRSDKAQRYNGMRFPASDIPVQARALYKRSLLRLIADVKDEGSPIIPQTTMSGVPIDLSLSVTRSVSPIHIEYLKNMGVQASMSVSIMKDGELWGLFACHHDSPRYIDYERRTAIELFAHLFSYEISNFEDAARKSVEVESSKVQNLLMSHMAAGEPLANALRSIHEDIKSVIDHDGLVLIEDEEIYTAGATPSKEQLSRIARHLNRTINSRVFHTDKLLKFDEFGHEYEKVSVGMLAIPISKRPRDYMLLFRKPVTAHVNWAGDPNKPVTVGPNGVRLTPRQSFDVWQQTVEGQSAPWTDAQLHAAELLRVTLLEVYLKITDAANLERKRAQENQQLLISELNHRVRNILNLMGGLVAQSRSSARTLEEFTQNLDGRIQSLARAHDQLTEKQWEPTSLKQLIKCEFDAYSLQQTDRVEVTGPDAMITPNAFTTMALVLHEMATNSVKYGALFENRGQVQIDLSADANGGIVLNWVERGGPAVTPPKRRGFGTMIIENSVPHELGGDADIDYKMMGVEARFRLPSTAISQIVQSEQTEAPTTDVSTSTNFGISGTALVVEDTLIIAMDLAEMLKDFGASKVEVAATVSAAMEWLSENHVDFALLDVNLGSEQSLPIAVELAKRDVPFILATGYGASGDLIKAYPPCEIIQKPISDSSLQAALEKLDQND
ncbi:histidine kinase [Marivivens niveibacter]|uniref:histidine kinase n=1 Tax=Marivivens niveibacter TaxID=1930667 RepID=A0A251WX33_9RHOB|nr:HWE histidine kinase domain-containing protein [Marivivens niveibacter]OUD08523.1 histidine kinase [Marivivens niveibacter]